MGRWQPYQYNERNSAYGPAETFNPKAVTMASRRPPSPTKKKADGPLVNINRHPDSYLVLPYGKTDAKPMNPRVKLYVKITRWIQFAFRLFTLLGAIGALLCGIFIRGAQTTEGYIIRIPPGVDIVNTLYAIYHLLRSAKARTPSSSASYHFFALVMDAGFIPFYVFTAILAKRNYNEEAGTDGRWRTFFPTDEDTGKVLDTTWLMATAVAGLHCASLIMDLYLVLVFRKISNMPPDMNPLEDNLTSRRKTKHKHKNSSISAITPLTAEDKRCSAQTNNSTVFGDQRRSQVESYILEKDVPSPDVSKMAFLHTRTDSAMTYSPHTPNSARNSRAFYSQPASAQQSRGDLNHRDDLHRRDDEDGNETLAQRKSLLAQQAIKRHSRPNSTMSSKNEQFYTPPSTADKQSVHGDISIQKPSRESLQSDNWFVHGGGLDDEPAAPPPKMSLQSKSASMFPSMKSQGYNKVQMYDDVSDDDLEPPMMPQPLRMNPPTPPPAKTFAAPPAEVKTSPIMPSLKRTQTTTSMSSESTFNRSHSRASTPKSRYYGDLKAATHGIRSGNSPANSPGSSPIKSKFGSNHLPSATKQYTTNSPVAAKTYTTRSPFTLDKKVFSSVRRTGEAGYTPVTGQSPRVISRTGVDYDGRYDFADDFSDLGTPGRRREVSGKIAEEGRGGCRPAAGWGGDMQATQLTFRKISGVA